MAKNPSTRWFWNDWIADPAVRACSMAARGLWIDMLALMAVAKRPGYLEIGVPELSNAVGATRRCVARYLAELERNGVFSRDADGTIFSRRMAREAVHKNDQKPSKKRPVNTSKANGLQGEKSRTLDSGLTEGESTQDSKSTSSTASSLNAARASQGESEKHKKENPEEGRCAPLAEPPPPCAASQSPTFARRCEPPPLRKPPKSPALKAKIRDQLQQKHARYLIARRRPEELAAYWATMLDPDPVVAQRAFDETDRRMRAAGWDDMRGWKQAQGIA